MPEAALNLSPVVMLLVQVTSTLAGVAVTVYIGFVKLSERFEASREANDLAHEQIVAELKEQNGYIRDHATAISEMNTRLAIEEELGNKHREEVTT